MKRVTVLLIAASLLAGTIFLAGCGGGDDTPDWPSTSTLKYVDTHVHLGFNKNGGYEQGVASTLASMDELGIVLSLIMPAPRQADKYTADDYRLYASAVKSNPGRLGFLAGGGSLNPLIQKAVASGQVTDEDRQLFAANAEAIAASGAVGYGEMTAEHFSLRPDHPYESAPPDHPLFLMLSDIAASKNMPIDLHMEAVPGDEFPFPRDQYTARGINPETLNGNVEALERLLAHNRDTRIIWDHVGWDHTGYRTPGATRRMLAENPNLYMSIPEHPDGPEQNRITKDGVIKPEWMEVFEEFPDRFLLGSDVGPGGPSGPRKILNQLPPELARKLAYENANAVFGLEVSSSDAEGTRSY